MTRLVWFAALTVAIGSPASLVAGEFEVSPESVELDGNFARSQLLVRAIEPGAAATNRSADLTHAASYVSSNPEVATVSPTGQLLAVGDGQAVVTVSVEGLSREVPVSVSGVVAAPTVGFAEQVLPVIGKAGCNAGACHASQYGKGGFILSVFAFEPEQDREAIVRDRQGRRVNFLTPEESLILKKPTLSVPHGGGRRLSAGSVDYQILKAWLETGALPPAAEAPTVTELSVVPNERIGAEGFTQQLRVLATYSNGKVADVTHWARFDSLDDAVALVTREGLVTASGRGQAPVMVRFEGKAALATFAVPFADSTPLAGWESRNFVDELAAERFRELGIEPSSLCDDATFLRRAYLDSIGTLPTVEESVAFLDSPDPAKRERLVDALLGLTGDPARDIYNDSYAAYWALKWSDLIRSSTDNLGEQGMWSMYNWIRESFRVNKPFDQFVRELVTAKGSVYSSGPANFYRIANSPPELAESTAQLFLGVRLQCAKCHHHPFEKYSQEDYYGFAAFFSRVGTKSSDEFGVFGGEQVVVVRSGGEVTHPRTGEVMPPTPLDGEPIDDPLDRRIPLAAWLTSSDNRLFAQNVVNRTMGYLLGRGLVEPIDDLRATNPPSNPPLMEALTDEFIKNGFDVRKLQRTIMTSRLYQLDSQPTAQNAADRRLYSHFHVKRVAAEPLLDAVDQATGVQTKFPNLPLGTRAIELPDTEYQNHFLTTFGKPRRVSVCECERMPDENLAQALHTLNGDILAGKITDANGRVARLVGANAPHETIVEELYLATLCRRPTSDEQAACRDFLTQSPSPKEAYEDLLWALVNSKQFLFVR